MDTTLLIPAIPGNPIPVPEGPRERPHIPVIPKSFSSFSPHQRITRGQKFQPCTRKLFLGNSDLFQEQPQPHGWDLGWSRCSEDSVTSHHPKAASKRNFSLSAAFGGQGEFFSTSWFCLGRCSREWEIIPWNSSLWRTPSLSQPCIPLKGNLDTWVLFPFPVVSMSRD